jgi:hypothetical protein
LLALCGGAVALSYAWAVAFASPQRPDGNSGHAMIDFGCQWLMGRMIVEGEGRHLYHRPTIRTVLERGYPRADEDPASDKTDADRLMDWLSQGDGKIAPRTLGGPLYPPVHGLLYSPLGMLSPRAAYRVVQTVNLLLVFAIGWLAERLSGGRIWCPVAALLLMLWPGYAGVINLGQNAALSLFLATFGWWLTTRGRPALGGVVWGLLAFKPVWAVAFFPVTLLSGRWRMALAMAATGLALVALTLPLVGWQVWLDWLTVGRLATAGYARDWTWIVLSRDLQGLVRRFFLESPTDPLPTRLALGLWLAVSAVTVVVALRHRRAVRADDGPGAAFLLFGAWLGCFHFMYYDTLLAALPLLLLLTPPQGNKVVPFIGLVLLIVSHYVATWVDPTFRFPPFDTYLVLSLWAWCGWQIRRAPALRRQAAQLTQPGPDVVGAHQ